MPALPRQKVCRTVKPPNKPHYVKPKQRRRGYFHLDGDANNKLIRLVLRNLPPLWPRPPVILLADAEKKQVPFAGVARRMRVLPKEKLVAQQWLVVRRLVRRKRKRLHVKLDKTDAPRRPLPHRRPHRQKVVLQIHNRPLLLLTAKKAVQLKLLPPQHVHKVTSLRTPVPKLPAVKRRQHRPLQLGLQRRAYRRRVVLKQNAVKKPPFPNKAHKRDKLKRPPLKPKRDRRLRQNRPHPVQLWNRRAPPVLRKRQQPKFPKQQPTIPLTHKVQYPKSTQLRQTFQSEVPSPPKVCRNIYGIYKLCLSAVP